MSRPADSIHAPAHFAAKANMRHRDYVRDYAEDYTRRVRDDRLRNPLARMLAPELDPDVAVERWQQLRASAGGPFDGEDGPESEPAADGTGPSGTGMSAGTRRQWWPFGRRTL